MLSSRTQYALIILDEINTAEIRKAQGIDERLPKLRTISEKYVISVHFLEQVARDLRVAGLIKSQRGPGGGYYRGKDSISFLDVMKAINKKNHKSVSSSFDQSQDIIKKIEDKLNSITILK